MPRHRLDAAAVVEAAARLTDKRGLHALTLAALAADLGVRPPSLYAHVGGLEDLRVRLAARAAQQLAGELSAAAVGRHRGEAVRALCGAYRRYALEHRGSYEALQLVDLVSSPAAVPPAEAVVGVVLSALRGYGLEGDDALHATRAVRSAVHGFVALETGGGFGLELSMEESFERLVRMLEIGIAASAADEAPPNSN